MKKQYTIFNAEAIIDFALFANTNNMNRQIHHKIIRLLDPFGVNILLFKMEHNHAQGKEVDPHLRLFILVKLQEREAPVKIDVDVSIDLFEEHSRPYIPPQA